VRTYEIVSADGHVIEPPDLWSRFLPGKFKDRAPKLVKDPEGGDAWELIPGTPPMPLGLVTNRGEFGKRYEDLKWYGDTYDTIRRGAFDGRARVEEQDIDGVDGEIIYPSQRTMAVFMAQEDDDFHLAGIEAYNTWVSTEFNAVSPDRLFGLAQTPAVDVNTSVKWLREAKQVGFKGVIISAWPSGGAELSGDDDPFWEAAEEEQMPVHIHSGLSHAGKRTAGAGSGKAMATQFLGKLPDLQQMGGAVAQASDWMSKLIYSGMFDRFPDLKMVAVECGAGWIPHFLEHMDDHWWRNRTWTQSTLKLLPSEYFRRNWLATFIREPFAIQVRHHIGVRNLMWSTDYPHHRHDWPYSRRVIEESMLGVPEGERRRMVAGNAVELYGLAS
jgi:predicted TIM-barrel fold metal-dependent hydrolase